MGLPIDRITAIFITGELERLLPAGATLPLPKRETVTRPHERRAIGERAAGAVRVVCVSDTHSNEAWTAAVPPGDVLIHAGDLTLGGTRAQLERAFRALRDLPHAVKLVVPGNHDLGLDRDFVSRHAPEMTTLGSGVSMDNIDAIRAMWTSREAVEAGIVYLEHGETTITANGRRLRVFGSGWTPAFFDWAFMYPVDQDIWSPSVKRAEPLPDGGIEDGIDICITHGPLKGVLDEVPGIGCVGCPFLKDRVDAVQPRLHVFGHIHEGAELGLSKRQAGGRETTSVNASLLDHQYQLVYRPTVIDL